MVSDHLTRMSDYDDEIELTLQESSVMSILRNKYVSDKSTQINKILESSKEKFSFDYQDGNGNTALHMITCDY